jgi:hypothetical protein
MAKSFYQMYMQIKEDAMPPAPPPAGGMGGPPPPGGMGGMPPPGGDPMAGMGGPPGAPPGGADPNAHPKAIEVKASNWIDFLEKALDKLEGKATPDDTKKGQEDSGPPQEAPPEQPMPEAPPTEQPPVPS